MLTKCKYDVTIIMDFAAEVVTRINKKKKKKCKPHKILRH